MTEIFENFSDNKWASIQPVKMSYYSRKFIAFSKGPIAITIAFFKRNLFIEYTKAQFTIKNEFCTALQEERYNHSIISQIVIQ